jgi:hypothetical protein
MSGLAPVGTVATGLLPTAAAAATFKAAWAKNANTVIQSSGAKAA